MSIRRATLVLASVACLLMLIAMPAAGRQVPRQHPVPVAPSRPAFKHGNRVHVAPTGGPFANSSYPRDLVSHGGFVWFDAYAPTHNNALWKSDTFNTTAIKDDIDPSYLEWAGNKLFFVGNDGAHGDELWVSDGTPGGTHQIKDAVTGTDGASIYDLAAVGSKVYYQANDEVHGYEPWVSDGTPSGTHMLRDIASGEESSNPYDFARIGNRVVFRAWNIAHGHEPWVSDGTTNGTVLLKDVLSGPDSSYPYQFTRIGSRLIFSADDGVHGYEPWFTNGTQTGTKLLKDIAPGTLSSYTDAEYTFFTVFDGRLWFTANDGVHNAELWKTDGTPGGTKLAVDMRPGARAGNPYEADATSNALYLEAEDGNHGFEIWKSDGTKAGTAMLKDIRPGFQGSYPYLDGYESSPIGPKMLFSADDGVHGHEPWVTNGTANGTKMVMDILGGSESSNPFDYVTVPTGTIRGTVVFFVAENNAVGQELFFTNGTNSGTHVIDLFP